jgi:hypothetical protein
MSSSQRVRPSIPVRSQVQPGRFDYSESGRLNSNRVRKLLGENCTLSDSQIEELTDGLHALAELTVAAFAEQRRQRKMAVSEQPELMPEVAAPIVAVA